MSGVRRYGTYHILTGLILIRDGRREEFEAVSENLADALEFCRTIGAEPGGSGGFEVGGARGVLSEVDLYTRRVPFFVI